MTIRMRTLKFHYFSGLLPGSLIIRARLSSKFSHVGIEMEDGAFWEATMLHGVLQGPFNEHKSKPEFTSVIEVPEERYLAIVEFLRSIEGAKYDWKGILGFIIAKRVESDTAYFCSELGRIVFELGVGFKYDLYNLVTPGQLRLMTETYRLVKER